VKLLVYGDIGGSGGYIRYCKGVFASGMIPQDVQVWFVCSLDLYKKLEPLDSAIKVITHPWILSKKRFYRYLWHLWVYPRIVKKIKPDIEFYPTGQLRLFFRKAKTIATCHNLLLFDQNELNKITNKAELQYFLGSRKSQSASFLKSDGVIFLSRHSKEVVKGQLNNIKRSTVIAHGLDATFLQKSRTYDFDSSINIVYISPFFNYKNQIEVVKAIEILRDETKLDICLKLIGGGTSTYAAELKQYVKKSDRQRFVTIIDKVEYLELLSEYQKTDIFVFASSSETFGITVLEAMGARLPIACSDRTGLPEILKDAGVYFNPEEPSSIAEAIRQLIESVELRKMLGERAYQYALNYRWDRCSSETINFIKEVEKD
jgi:glycosyltransferase involved in cell wall biosynthesis